MLKPFIAEISFPSSYTEPQANAALAYLGDTAHANFPPVSRTVNGLNWTSEVVAYGAGDTPHEDLESMVAEFNDVDIWVGTVE